MAKAPPPLSIVSGAKAGVEPPRPLGNHGCALYERVQREYGITDVGGVELLTQICQAEDRAEQLAEVIARDGHTIYTRARAYPSRIRRSATSWRAAPSSCGSWSAWGST